MDFFRIFYTNLMDFLRTSYGLRISAHIWNLIGPSSHFSASFTLQDFLEANLWHFFRTLAFLSHFRTSLRHISISLEHICLVLSRHFRTSFGHICNFLWIFLWYFPYISALLYDFLGPSYGYFRTSQTFLHLFLTSYVHLLTSFRRFIG